ncbi:glycosyltransferase family protein [Hymenobacter chitinivorans]|uniref:4-amino-4-deoxy-L-arabinose transferase-like glycosyltransferase n=1 Tax=Hymenobacter chitinivorans DSM 11115 TaxID=1121954 RepID=A0A2M9AS20_9BACT|nr:hypothetical protein [Hymenobacter chitinivorans]PJJ48479.1 4-amino-4-deoxy-L-arabinose transferase-like glycosyltransferase [Hymenobacter chitinivorans DSM 11115]
MILSRRNYHWLGLAGVGLATAAILTFLFSFALAHPDDYFFQAGGDGIQSYFATAYYALYDSGSHFSGMNYPFGEDFNYPNLQPLIAWVMNLLQRLGVPAGQHTIAITNLVALASVLVTPMILYAILRRTRMSVGYAAVLALIIGFLSPQIQRLGDHMSLSYTCFVPLLWYFIIRMQEAPRQWRWYVLFGVSSLLMGGVMLYFLTCGCFFLLGHVVILSLRRPRPLALIWRMALTAILPLVVFRVWMLAIDPTADRPPNPYGFLVYMATPRGVFTPSLEPLHGLWQSVFPTEEISYESMSYVGLVATGVLVAAGLLLLWRAWQLRQRPARLLARQLMPPHLSAGLGAASLLLLFSFAIPFTFPGFEHWIDYLGPLKQFRALGRFAWPFYYVMSTYAAYYLYRLLRYQRLRRLPILAAPWVPMLLLFWAGEAWINISSKAQAAKQGFGAAAFLAPQNNLVQQLSWASRSPKDFQAIMPLPYMNKGSDKIDLSGSAAATYEAHRLAVATGLPELSTYVSRPSVEHMLRHVQLLSSPLVEKTLLQKFPSDKPILLLVTTDALTPAEQRLVSIATRLVTVENVTLYELPVAALGATSLAQERAKAAALLPTLPQRPGGLYTSTDRGVVYESFADKPDRRGRLAPGALYEPKEANTVLYDGPLPTPTDTARYEASVWVNGKLDYGYGVLRVKQFNGNSEVSDHAVDGRLTTEVDGDWVRLQVVFRPAPGVNRIQVIFGGRDILADDLLIRPLTTDVYWYDSRRQPVLNTYPLAR